MQDQGADIVLTNQAIGEIQAPDASTVSRRLASVARDTVAFLSATDDELVLFKIYEEATHARIHLLRHPSVLARERPHYLLARLTGFDEEKSLSRETIDAEVPSVIVRTEDQ